MKKCISLFCLIMLAIEAEAQNDRWSNRVSADLDGHLRYECILPYGFSIGTDWRYLLVFEGTKYFHADQQPQIWIITASHLWKTKFIEWENRLSFMNFPPINFTTINYSSCLRKTFILEERWGLSPFIRFLDYGFDGSEYGSEREWWEKRAAHHLEVRSKLGIELQIQF